MSLINASTSAQLGIRGSVSDFAAGIKSRRKKSRGLTREQALANKTANEGQDARLQHSGDIKPKHDPKKTQGTSLMLTEDDKAFIEKVQFLERKVFKGTSEIGKNATERLKGEVTDLLNLAANSSRTGLADIWANVFARVKGQHGRTAPGGLAKLQDAFSTARQATSKVLNLDIDLATYKFDPGRETKVTVEGGEKSYAAARRDGSASAQGGFAWDATSPLASDGLSIGDKKGDPSLFGSLGIR